MNVAAHSTISIRLDGIWMGEAESSRPLNAGVWIEGAWMTVAGAGGAAWQAEKLSVALGSWLGSVNTGLFAGTISCNRAMPCETPGAVLVSDA